MRTTGRAQDYMIDGDGFFALVSQVIRGYFSKMITQFYPNLYVLAFNEITNNVQIQAIGNVTNDAPTRPERKAVAT